MTDSQFARSPQGTAGLELYTSTAHSASRTVIERYSTSFGLASRLLPDQMRSDIEAVYALVRVADEVVDGPARQAGLTRDDTAVLLDAFEQDTGRAMATGFSSNLVVHASADTARRVGIAADLTTPFFSAMRRDLDPVDFETEQEVRDYIYGSAEVVGLMCVRCFTYGSRVPAADARRIDAGARSLGSAFQLVNFVRDLGSDSAGLGRAYLPGVDPKQPSAEAVEGVLDQLEGELRHARETIELLPADARPAVVAAHDLFAALARRIRSTPVAALPYMRVSVPSAEKAAIIGRAALSTGVLRIGRARDAIKRARGEASS